MRQAKKEPHEGQPPLDYFGAFIANTRHVIFAKRFPRLHYVRFKSEQERDEMNASIAKELGH